MLSSNSIHFRGELVLLANFNNLSVQHEKQILLPAPHDRASQFKKPLINHEYFKTMQETRPSLKCYATMIRMTTYYEHQRRQEALKTSGLRIEG